MVPRRCPSTPATPRFLFLFQQAAGAGFNTKQSGAEPLFGRPQQAIQSAVWRVISSQGVEGFARKQPAPAAHLQEDEEVEGLPSVTLDLRRGSPGNRPGDGGGQRRPARFDLGQRGVIAGCAAPEPS
jgi:hypothetical protein